MPTKKRVHAAEEVIKASNKAVEIIEQSVFPTLGASGNNVLIEQQYGVSRVTKDGVSVINELEVEDPLVNSVLQILKKAPQKINKEVGDGTTSSAVFTASLVREANKEVREENNVFRVIQSMERGGVEIIKSLQKQSRPIDSKKKIKQVATTSANHDIEIGENVAKAIDMAGESGSIVVEDSKGVRTEIVKSTGLEIDKGYLSNYFVKDEKRMQVVLEDPYILISKDKISSMVDILGILEKLVAKNKKSILFIAEDVDGVALKTLIYNAKTDFLKTAAVKAPGYGDDKSKLLQDIAVITGATVISEENGLPAEKIEIDHLGQAGKVIISRDKTVIVGGKGNAKKIEDRRTLITQMRREEDVSDYEGEKMLKRAALLGNGVITIYVGGFTETERNEKRDLYEDSLNSTQSAIKEGVNPGGGISYLRSISSLETVKTSNKDEIIGINILKKALSSICHVILQNKYGKGAKAWGILNELFGRKGDQGFDVLQEDFCSLLERGIIDSTKSITCVIQYGISVAISVLSCRVALVSVPEKEKDTTKEKPGIPGGGMGMM